MSKYNINADCRFQILLYMDESLIYATFWICCRYRDDQI